LLPPSAGDLELLSEGILIELGTDTTVWFVVVCGVGAIVRKARASSAEQEHRRRNHAKRGKSAL
jgi:hypothetical protein